MVRAITICDMTMIRCKYLQQQQQQQQTIIRPILLRYILNRRCYRDVISTKICVRDNDCNNNRRMFTTNTLLCVHRRVQLLQLESQNWMINIPFPVVEKRKYSLLTTTTSHYTTSLHPKESKLIQQQQLRQQQQQKQQKPSCFLIMYQQKYRIQLPLMKSLCSSVSSYHSSSSIYSNEKNDNNDDEKNDNNDDNIDQNKQSDNISLSSTTTEEEATTITSTSSASSSSNDNNHIEDIDDDFVDDYDDDPNIIINSSRRRRLRSKVSSNEIEKRMKQKSHIHQLMGKSLLSPSGRLWKNHNQYSNEYDYYDNNPMLYSSNNNKDNTNAGTDSHHNTTLNHYNYHDPEFIPQVSITGLLDGRKRKRVLVLCTGGTLCMAPDPLQGNALAPVQGALSNYMKDMNELTADHMPDVVLHEYNPFYDSSDLGPSDWVCVANDIRTNYYDFDGFVVLSGTDTMAYFATSLSFLFENLNKPIVFTGSQIPLCEPYNDGRRNLIMALIFASSNEPINEVTIYFHDRLLRANRTTKVNTQSLLAFDSPNQIPLANIGIRININEHLLLSQSKGQLRVHNHIDTRILTLRLVPGFDDSMISEIIHHNISNQLLSALIIQFYGTGNLPSVKNNFIQLLAHATSQNILVIASTQCHIGSVMMGQYAVGKALESAGVISSNDMTIEAIACKIGYLLGRCDLNHEQISKLMGISLRGEITPINQMKKMEFNPITPYHRHF